MKTWTEQEWRSSVDQTLLEKYPDACAQAKPNAGRNRGFPRPSNKKKEESKWVRL